MISDAIGIAIAFIVICVLVYVFFGNRIREAAVSRAARREQFGDQYDRFKDTDNNPFIRSRFRKVQHPATCRR